MFNAVAQSFDQKTSELNDHCFQLIEQVPTLSQFVELYDYCWSVESFPYFSQLNRTGIRFESRPSERFVELYPGLSSSTLTVFTDDYTVVRASLLNARTKCEISYPPESSINKSLDQYLRSEVLPIVLLEQKMFLNLIDSDRQSSIAIEQIYNL